MKKTRLSLLTPVIIVGIWIGVFLLIGMFMKTLAAMTFTLQF